MRNKITVLILTVLACIYASPSFSVSCTYNGSIEYDNSRLGFDSCAGGELKRIGSYVTTDVCSDKAEIEWNNLESYLEYCNGSFEVPLKCGVSLGVCDVPGEQRYDSITSSMQMCDGTNWYSMNTSACIDSMGDISWVAVGSKNSLIVSDTGERWLPVDLPDSIGVIYDVDYGDGVWVAVGDGPSIISSIDGKVWSQVNIGGLGVNSVPFTALEYADGLWMASQGYGGNTTATSPDGIVWTAVSNYNNGYSWGLVKTKNYWVAGGDSGRIKYSASNGNGWASYSFGASGDPQALGYANGYLLVKKSTGSFAILESEIGSSHEYISNYLSSSIKWAGNNFITGSDGSGIVYDTTSTSIEDLSSTWRQYDIGNVPNWVGTIIGFGNGKYVFGTSSGQLAYSSDLTTFSNLIVPTSGNLKEVAYGGVQNDPGTFSFNDLTDVSLSTFIESNSITISTSMTVPQKVYVGHDGQVQINGGSWTSGDGSSSVSAGDTLKVRVKSDFGRELEKITSIQVGSHTTHWSFVTEPLNISWLTVHRGDTLENKVIMFSENGLDWYSTEFTNMADVDIEPQFVEYANGKWIIGTIGDKDVYISSADGFNWQEHTISADFESGIDNFETVHYKGENEWLAVVSGSVNGPHKIFKSTDNAETWSSTGASFAGWGWVNYLSYDDNQWVISKSGKSYISDDAVTWNEVTSTTSDTSIAGYVNGVWQTRDSQFTNDLDSWAVATNSIDAPIVFSTDTLLKVDKVSGGYYTSTDNGKSFINTSNSLGDLVSAGYGNGYFYALQWGGGLAMSSSATSWENIFNVTYGDNNNLFSTKFEYGGIHTDPGHFTFTDVSNTELATLVESDVITIDASMTSSQKVFAGNDAEVQINGGAWVAGDGSATVTAGDTLKIRVVSSSKSLTPLVTSVQVGGYMTHWKVTTKEYLVNWIQGLNNAKIMLATDGSNAIEIDVSDVVADASVKISSVEYGNGLWVAVGSSETILKSENAFDWEVVPTPTALSGYNLESIKYSDDSNVWYIGGRLIGGNPNRMVAFNGDLTVSEDLGQVSAYGIISAVIVNGKVNVFTNYGYFEGTDTSILTDINLTSTSNVPGDIDHVNFANGYWYGTAYDQVNLYRLGEGLDPFEANWTSFTLDDHSGYKYKISTGGNKVIMSYQKNNGVTYFEDVSTTQNVRTSSGIVSSGEFANGNWFIYGYQTQYAYWDDALTSIASGNASQNTNSVTYGGIYNDPGAFTFATVSETEVGQLIESDVITIDASMTSTQKVYAGNGAEIQVNGGSWVAGDGTASVTAGDSVKVRMTTPDNYSLNKTTTVQIGTRVTHWTLSTRKIIASWAAIGDDQFALSEDGVQWFTVSLPLSMTAVSSLEYGDGKWLVGGTDVNDKGVLAYSSDAVNWSAVDLSAFNDGGITGLSYGGGHWLARARSSSGSTGQTIISSDGENWSLATTPPSSYSGGYEYARGVWINSGYNIYKSTDNGDNWVKKVDVSPIGGLVYGNGRWLVLSNSDIDENYFASDDNGETWTRFDASAADSGVRIFSNTFAKDNFYYTDQGSKIWYGNEISSTFSSVSLNSIAYGITFADDKWMISKYQKGIYYSSDDDLSTFTRVLDNGTSMRGIKYGGSHNDPGDFEFTDITDVSLSTVIESDSVTVSSSMTTPQKVYAWNGAEIQVNGGAWVAGDGSSSVSAGDTLKVRMTSPLASLQEKTSTIQVGSHITHWTVKTQEFNVTWALPAADGGEYYIAVSQDNPTSAEDFLKIDTTPFFGSNMAQQIAYGNGTWVAVRQNKVIYSLDGLEWTQAPDAPSNVQRLEFWPEKQMFIWDSYTGNALYSTDGINWSAASGGSNYSEGLTTSKNYAYLGSHSSHTIKVSSDAQTWVDFGSSFTGLTTSPLYGDGLLVLADGLNSLKYSEDENIAMTDVSLSLSYFGEMNFGGGYFVRVRNHFSGQPIGYATANQLKRNEWNSITAPFGGWHGRIEFGNGSWLQYGYSGVVAKYSHEQLINNIGGVKIYDVDATGWAEYGGLANDPGYFSFADITNTIPNTVIESESITIGDGVSNTLYVYAGHGAEVQVNGGSWLAGTGSATVMAGDSFKVRMNASNYGALRKKVSTVQVGTQVSHWQVTNMDFDDTPNATDFSDVMNVETSSLIESDIIQIAGVDYAVAVSVSLGGEYRTCNDASCSSVVLDWSNYNEYIDPNDYIQVRHLSAAEGETSNTTALQIGDLQFDWMTTTYDNTPNALADFTDIIDVSLSTLVESDIIQINDIYDGISITVTGDEEYAYRRCSDASCTSILDDWSKNEIIINNGDYLQVRVSTARGGPAETEVIVTFGGGDIDWIVTTEKYDLTPFGFNPSVWYDAKDIDGDFVEEGLSENGLNGAGLVTWEDKGFYDIDVTQTTSSLQPIYDGEKVFFDGNDDYLTRGYHRRFESSSGTTVFLVTDIYGGTGYRNMVNMRSSNGGYNIQVADIAHGDDFDLRVVDTSGNHRTIDGPSYTHFEKTYLTGIIGLNSQKFEVNNLEVNTSNYAHQPADETASICLGAAGEGSCVYHNHNGHIYEVMIFDGWVNATSRTIVYNYLQDKWKALEIADVETDSTNTLIYSDVITYRGLGSQTVNVTNGAEVQVNSGSWVGTGVATITSGDSLRLRMTSASTAPTAVTTNVTIGSKSTTWNVKTLDSTVFAPMLWLDAKDVDGDFVDDGIVAPYTVSTWVDKSSFGFDASQTLASAQPTSDGLAMTFDGTSDYLEVSYDERLQSAEAYTFFIVTEVNGNDGLYRTPLSMRYSNSSATIRTGFNVYAGSNNQWQFWTGDADIWDQDDSGEAVVNGIVEIYHGAMNSVNNKRMYHNNVQVTSGGKLFKNHLPTSLCIGSINVVEGGCSTANLMHNGKMYEVLVYDSILSEASMTEIYNYLNNKWIDNTPDTVDFTDATNVTPSTTVESDIVQITGVLNAVSVDVSGTNAEYRICSDASCTTEVQTWTSIAGLVTNGQYVQLKSLSAGPDSFSDVISTLAPQNWYKFNETSGTTLYDYGSVGVNGIYVSGSYSLGNAGLTATGDLAVGLTSSYEVNAPASATAWLGGTSNYSSVTLFKTPLHLGPDALYSIRQDNGVNEQIYAFLHTNHHIFVNDNTDREDTGMVVTEGKDYALFVTKNGTAMTADLYDLADQTSQTYSWTAFNSTVVNYSNTLTFGELNEGYSDHLDGVLDDVVFFNSTLTPTNISDIKEAIHLTGSADSVTAELTVGTLTIDWTNTTP